MIEFSCVIACAEKGAQPVEVHHTHITCEDPETAYTLAIKDALMCNVRLHGVVAVFIEAAVQMPPDAVVTYELLRQVRHRPTPTHPAPPHAH